MVEVKKENHAYLKILSFLSVFSIIFIFNFVFPLEKGLLHFYNIDTRMWKWTELLVLGLAIFYTFKIRTLNFKDLVMSIVLGFVVCFANFKNYGYISGIATVGCYYAACQIFRYYSQENKFFDLKTANTVKSLFYGFLYSIPFALINNTVIYFTYGNKIICIPDMLDIIIKSKEALSPAISEEVIWHFFLLAFTLDLFKGNLPKNKIALTLIYILTVIPHCLVHLPNVILNNPYMALFQLLFISILFGFPMAWFVKNKNLQTSVGFHWGVDFIRFLFLNW